MSVLAINGGKKVRKKLFPAYNTIGEEEKVAVEKVLDKGKLSRFLGCWHEDFYGGDEVRALEKEWAEKFGVKHAISVNSATSALYCAVGAAGVGPGDEIIVSPYTMTASASAALVYNAIPVFADIEKDYYCLDADSVEERITERTKAIIVVDIMGQPYDADKINAIAKKHNLLVIEDAAQAPGAIYKGKYAGTLGDIGIFSLNYHKHIHSGEGGIIVTNDDELANKLKLIRNHAEAVVEEMGYTNLVNMIGFNYRMTEVEAAIAREQLKKLDKLLEVRLKNVQYISKGLSQIPCLEVPKERPQSEHAYYLYALKFKQEVAGVSREKFVEAVKAELTCFEMRETEGVKIGCGYVKPLYLQPIFQKLIGYGEKGCPFKCPMYKGKLNYDKGICPVCEDMHFKELIAHEFVVSSMTKEDMDDVICAFKKVWQNREELI
ncbi:beta-eliminating lyase family protein [Clostridium sporogenes]|uniref:DegT/DnrJ/EryC1/StrS family aminotransferase n=1 Tax=Clostridium TaxID=1485 RepID=UPI0005F91775|nr:MULTISPECIES: DegT/DnrJ/EryC1/StrS family aminotransferase [Clostridium]APF26249.1 beta-eliminating lyase family protein [Clostridium sporogenes]MDI6919518.1 DegT/DnrJ/EryC1/StrS family aminotransferase [Clostridium botulinum]WMU96768.1 DegT/DnrJ/EryC1/StrS family aminotransferase [Clostridium botulinum]